MSTFPRRSLLVALAAAVVPRVPALVDDIVPLTQEERDALDFYNGNQWPADIREQRADQGRPCITFNRLPTIVDALVRKTETRLGRELTERERLDLIVKTVHSCKDSQMVYNYFRTAEVEHFLAPKFKVVGSEGIEL